ncbi:FAD/NAD(P)-binding oxidoreductase [Metarhizobium album]|uniref:FAD/NAD(P)-binding oxidoreductase n=1 Tax=Metarhizobium album TaxID=2182425 RepID=A0A2U2DJ21_9HYPH|nr:NAD(P)/FAD-dependent oxidoreductase [Rhizobium album]PWE53313.1 FAD/NAD(P)-binding oxidoreductase [Rhizobium album]
MSMRVVTEAGQLALHYDLVVVGAGPAGLSAATEAAAAGASVLVADENLAPGGQIYRGITRNTPERQDFFGKDYWKGRAITDAFAASSVDYAAATTVWSLDAATSPLSSSPRRGEGGPKGRMRGPSGQVLPCDAPSPPCRDLLPAGEKGQAAPSHSICDSPASGEKTGVATLGLTLAGAARMVSARAVILATGAMERPMAVPGWTLPGVMSAGAAQIALKSVSGIPAGRIVLAGCGPLLYLLADQLLRAGADIAALLDTADSKQRMAALRHLPDFLLSPYVAKGLSLLLGVRRRARVISGVTELAIAGSNHAEGVRFRAGGRQDAIAADCVLLHQGIIPGINLASAAGCTIEWNDTQRAFQPWTDSHGRTSLAGVLSAGDGAGIGGAEHAAVCGRIAALAALADIGLLSSSQSAGRLAGLEKKRQTYRRGRTFLDTLYRPARQFLAPPDPDTMVCRCEEVRAGTLRQVIALGVPGPNQLKTFVRCGMGPCQGRMCASTVTEIMAEERGVSPAEIGTYRLRAPVKPLRLAELGALPQTPAAVFAVTGRTPEQHSLEEEGKNR